MRTRPLTALSTCLTILAVLASTIHCDMAHAQIIPIQLHAPPARIRFDSSPPGVALQIRTSTATVTTGSSRSVYAEADDYQIACIAPCEATLPAGTYFVALSRADTPPRAVEVPVFVRHGASLRGTYTSNSGVRLAGVLTGLLGALTGTALMFAPLLVDDRSTQIGLVATGAGLLFTSMITGVILAFVPDRADVETVP